MSSAEAEKGEAGEFLSVGTANSLERNTTGAPHPDALALPAGPSVSTANGGGPQGAVREILRQSSHPGVALAHMAFKIGAIVSYLLVGWFTQSFVIEFVSTVTLLAFDFWTVKNVSGRLLVGLRWWHDVADDDEDADGTVKDGWRFESIPDRESINPMDNRIFWGALYAFPVIWILLGVVCILKFNASYLVIVVIALVLSSANIVGYYKCNKDATEQMRAYIGKTMLGSAMERAGLGRLAQFVK